MAAPATVQTRRMSTGVFTDAELDYFDSLDADYFPSEETPKVGETTWHYLSIKLAFNLLERVFPEPSDVFIAANHFLYWDPRQRGQVIGADLYVVKGVGRKNRSSYKVWEEGGRVPDVVFEFASEETWRKDRADKKRLYEQDLRIPEYFLFDPIGRFLPHQLEGFRLEAGVYQPIEPANGRLHSEQLGLELLAEGMYLRFFDPTTGALVPTPEEVEMARREAEAKAEAEKNARLEAEAKATKAEAENVRLRAEMEALRRRLP